MWTTFAAMVAGAAAGLTGLMFIVVAFRYDTIATSTEYRNRAAQSLSLFLTVTVSWTLVTAPQPTQALGVELLLVGVGSAVLLTTLDRAARQAQSQRTNPVLLIALSAFFGCIAVSGVLLVVDVSAGMYLYAAAAVLGLVWGVYGAWIYLTRTSVVETA